MMILKTIMAFITGGKKAIDNMLAFEKQMVQLYAVTNTMDYRVLVRKINKLSKRFSDRKNRLIFKQYMYDRIKHAAMIGEPMSEIIENFGLGSGNDK